MAVHCRDRVVCSLGLALLALAQPAASSVQAAYLRVNAQIPPLAGPTLGLPTTGLELSWRLEPQPGAPRGIGQAGYLATIGCARTGAILWSSGNVTSPTPRASARPIPELPADGSFWLQVQVQPTSGPAGGPARALFDTAPSQASWGPAEWIGGANQLRSELTLPAGGRVVRARAYAVGLGAFVLSLDGQRVGDHVLDPPQSAYPKRLLYSSFDLTSRLASGRTHVFGAMLGHYKYGYMDVWCNMTDAGHTRDACLGFRMQLVAELSDGTTVTHYSSTAGWLGRSGPLQYDHEYHGEIFDARRLLPGWDSAPLNRETSPEWQPVALFQPRGVPDSALTASQLPPIRITESRNAVKITKIDHSRNGYTPVTCTGHRIGGEISEDQFGKAELTLACAPGSGKIEQIDFADFGEPTLARGCANASHGQCGVPNASAYVARLCLGRTSCKIAPRVGAFGGVDPCPNSLKRLVVIASGCRAMPSPPPHPLPLNETSYVFDFGQNVAGFTSIHATGPVGTKIYVRHAETLQAIPTDDAPQVSVKNGYCSNSEVQPGSPMDEGCTNCNSFVGAGVLNSSKIWGGNCANQTNLYIMAGTGRVESYQPEFMYAGFRYAQIWGLPAGETPTVSTLIQHFVHTDVPVVGQVNLPSIAGHPSGTADVLNRAQSATVYAQRSNLYSIPTDCPQRERRGWMGDAQMSSNEAMLNHDMEAFYVNFLRLIRDDQLIGCETPMGEGGGSCADPDLHRGSIPDVVPFTTGPYGAFPGSTVWQAAYPVIAYNAFRAYGNTLLIQEHWEGLLDLLAYWDRQPCSTDGLNKCAGLGDWIPVTQIPSLPHWPKETTPAEMCSAFYTILALAQLSEIATALEKHTDAATLARRFDAVSGLFWSQFGNQSSQTSRVMLIALNLAAPPLAQTAGPVPSSRVAGLADELASSIFKAGNHTSSGIIGATFVFDVLASTGHGGVAVEMLLKDDQPSFGYMLQQGATTLWENWAGSLPLGAQGSNNHIMFGGGIGTFTYQRLAGLANDRGASHNETAWRRISYRPLAAAILRLGAANASVITPRGKAAISWARVGGRLELNATVPVGSTADVAIPAPKLAEVREGGSSIWHQGEFCHPGVASGFEGVSVEATPERAVVFQVGSGNYTFKADYY